MDDFPQLTNIVYLDSAGSPPVPMPVLNAFTKDLQETHYGNPHSNHNSGSLTDLKVEKTRRRILE
jgi:molybdenum cofactor sulfurtransferase